MTQYYTSLWKSIRNSSFSIQFYGRWEFLIGGRTVGVGAMVNELGFEEVES